MLRELSGRNRVPYIHPQSTRTYTHWSLLFRGWMIWMIWQVKSDALRADQLDDGLTLRQSHQLTPRLAVAKSQEGGHGANAIARRGAGRLVDIDAEDAAAVLD